MKTEVAGHRFGARVGDGLFETHELHSAVVDVNHIVGVQDLCVRGRSELWRQSSTA
jgi:hypothetical protein